MSKKKIIIGALLACICITVALSHFTFNTSAEKAQVLGCDIETNYSYGEEFRIPDAKVSYKGTEKAAESKYIVFPSGKANESEKIVLSEDGKYEVVYKAKFNGITVSAKKTFIVNKRLLAINSDMSSATIIDNAIHVSLAQNDVLTYNESLNLSESSKEEPLLNIEFTPNTAGTADALQLNVRFTDLYDESNYVTVKIKSVTDSWGESIVYLSAGAANQSSIGVENLENPMKTIVHINDNMGTAAYSSMMGKPLEAPDKQLRLYFDYQEKAFYVDREVYSGGQNRMIIDLDDIAYFGTNLWDGFTTGDVKMTIFAENYQSATCNFIIAELNGKNQFNAEGDMEAPAIRVDTEYEKENLPTALVGKAYPVFDATAFDNYSGVVDVVVSAYYKYYSETPVKLSVTDDAFIPTKAGTYVIEYAAIDDSGNTATECLKIEAVEGEGLQFNVKDAVASTDTGLPTKVISGIDYTANSGNVDYSLIAKNKSTKEEVKIDNSDFEFVPMSDGDWEVTVTAKDYISTVSKTFDVKANHTSQPQVYDTTSVPKYFISGAKYNMSTLKGYDFSSGKGVATDMDIFVTESDGTEKQLESNEYIPTNSGTVTVTYRLTVDGKSCEKVYKATVLDVGYTGDLDLSKFFVTTVGSAEAETSATNITYTTKTNTKFDFINFVQVKKLSFSFQVGEANQYNKINIYLTDIETGKQIKLSYRRTEGGSAFSVNDGAEQEIDATFDGLDRNFALAFNNDTHVVNANSSVNLEVDKFLDGSEFKGFSNSLALFAVEMEGVSGVSQLVVNNINSHSMNNTRMDRFAPEIIVETKSGDRGIGEEIELLGAYAYDTVNPICTLTMDITGPDGEFVKDKDGVLLDGTQNPTKDYTLKLEDYGDYTIRYVATDGNGKTNEYVYAVTSKDVTGPTITLKNHKESAKQGKTVKIAKVKVEDNLTKECTVATYVFDPEGVIVEVVDGKFEATMSGIYTVRYMAFDENGNYAFASYEIDVK